MNKMTMKNLKMTKSLINLRKKKHGQRYHVPFGGWRKLLILSDFVLVFVARCLELLYVWIPCLLIYRITGNFCGFGLKRRHLIFADIFFLRIVNLGTETKICLYYRKQQLMHITVILRSKNIFSSLESFQTLKLLNTHLINFKFVFRN